MCFYEECVFVFFEWSVRIISVGVPILMHARTHTHALVWMCLECDLCICLERVYA